MKKVCVVLFLVSIVLQPGCRGTPRAENGLDTKPAAAGPRRSYFWDKDLRPTMALPSSSKPKPRLATVESSDEQVAKAGIESQQATRAAHTELLTASVEPIVPVRSQFAAT